MRKLIPYVGAPRTGPRRPKTEEERLALSDKLREKQRAAKEQTRGMATGVFFNKRTGRYHVKYRSKALPGSYATAEAAAAARAAAIEKDKSDAGSQARP